MKSSRAMMTMAALGALAMSGAVVAAPPIGFEERREAKHHKPSGNTPVPGGGKRERERRLARMAKQQG